MQELLYGMQLFFDGISQDETAKYSVETKIISFGDDVRHETDFINMSELNRFKVPKITPDGNTVLGAAMNEGMKALDERKSLYRQNGIPYYKPWMVIMTDGTPSDSWKQASGKAKELVKAGKLNLFGIGIGADYNHKKFSEILPPERPPVKLKDDNFKSFFSWISESLTLVSNSAPGVRVALPSNNGWASI